jgi:hypothetical protein
MVEYWKAVQQWGACKAKTNDGVTSVCPIRKENIKDKTKKCQGEDSIYHKENCYTWLHRQCAGLSKHNFELIIKNPSIPLILLPVLLVNQSIEKFS